MDRESADTIRKLKLMFEPRSIAFLGASNDPRKWGFRILSNIRTGGFKGRVYPVNPAREEILGLKVYHSVAEIPETPDLAAIVVPPPSVLNVVRECIAKGIKAGVVITAGFAEVSAEGEKLQREIFDLAGSAGMRLAGPNSQGITNPPGRLYCHMIQLFPPPGSISVVSQSGNIIATIARLAIGSAFGLAKCISSGNEADLHVEDYLEYLAQDPKTSVILCYIEGFKDGARFFEIAKEVTRKKPVVMLKVGETPAGAKAAKSHTASLAGSYAVFDAMRKQAGVIRASSLDQLVDTGTAFLCHPLPKGRRVGIVTAGGGWGVLAADACARLGLDVVSLPSETIRELDSFMPAWWSRSNPVDLVAGAFEGTVVKCIEALLRSPVVDGVIMLGIVPALPQDQFAPATSEQERERRREAIAAAIAGLFDKINELTAKYQKPIVVGSEPIAFSANLARKINRALAARCSVCYDMPHKAAMAMANLAQYSEYLNHDSA